VVIYSCGPGPVFPTVFISGNLRDHLGHAPEDFYADDRFLEGLVHPDDRSVIAAAHEAVGAGAVHQCEYRVRHRDGHYVYVLDHLAPHHDAKGAVIGFSGSWAEITKRVEREAALARREELNRAIIRNLPCGVFRTRPDGTILAANPALVRMFGFENAEEMLRASAESLYEHPEQRAWFMERCLRQGYYTNVEARMKRRDGTPFMVVMNTYAVTGEDGEVVFFDGTMTDVTEQRRTEADLVASQTRLNLALEVAKLGVWEHDYRTDRVVRSRQWTKTLGYSPEEIDDHLDDWFKLVHPEDVPRVREKSRAHEAGETQVFEVEHRLRTKSGDWKWILNWGKIVERDEQGHPVRAVGMHLDISARKEAEAALREKDERIRAIFETTPDLMFIKDRELRYVSVNPAMAELIGLPAAEIVGKTARDAFGHERGEELEALNHRVLAGETVDREGSYLAPEFNQIFHVVMVPLRNAQEQVIGLCGIARDISEIKLLQDLAARAQRLETAGRVAGQVAHDFNNLLGPLAGFPGLIRREIPEEHPALKYVDFMETAASRMAEINHQLLTLGRRGHYNLEVLDLNVVVRDAARQIVPKPEGLVLELDLADDLLNVKAGRSQVFRAIANLITNARDAMADVGRLTIRTENVYADMRCGHIDRIPRGEYVKLTVSDTGVGIPAETLARMFDPFFTTKTTDKQRGSGLGLSVVHAVVEDHHGHIDCESRPGLGTSMLLFLPTTREEAVEVSTEIAGGTGSILVVDDDELQREVVSSLLGKLGYEVALSESGENAVELMADSAFDLVILDMIMPGGIDGTETYRRLLEHHPDQRAILVSGYAESERVAEALRLGAGQFLRRPLTLQQLAEAVRRELDRAGRPVPTSP